MAANLLQACSRPAQGPYYLSRHAFACLGDHHCVFLDLRRDVYLTVGRDDIEALSPWVVGWKEEKLADVADRPVPGTLLQIADQLLERGLLTTVPSQGKELAFPRIAIPTSELERQDNHEHVSNRHAFNFFRASMDAWASLRWKPLEHTINGVRERKQSGSSIRRSSDNDTHLVEIFDYLRPYFPRDYLCIFDSLALVNFLARYKVFPDWIFGVRSDPFSAHCWVQQDSHVLNDSVEHVQSYLPIMSV